MPIDSCIPEYDRTSLFLAELTSSKPPLNRVLYKYEFKSK